VLIDLLSSFFGSEAPTPTLDRYKADGQQFNDVEVPARAYLSPAEQLAEFNKAHAQTLDLIARLPEEVLRRPGTLPWYGMEYALDDFIVYSYYGHKREHGAQIAVFRDKIGPASLRTGR